MSTSIAAQTRAITNETREALASTSDRAVAAFSSASMEASNVAAALDVALAVEDLRVLFDRPEIRARIVALQDTAIGFRTDRDPRQKNRKTNEYNKPYDYDTVRDCAIEATLRGVQHVGNQWNIISFRTYITREGFEYLIRRRKEITEFRPIVNVPKTMGGGALVECDATWKQAGVAQSLKVTIPVKTDDYSGADQIIGKATRKFLKRCYEMMTGNVTPEGDAEDASEPAVAIPSTAASVASTAAPRERKPRVIEAAPAVAQAETTAPVEAATDAPVEGVLQNRLAAFVAGEGATFDHFIGAAERVGFLEGADLNATSFLDLSDKACAKCLGARHGLRGLLAAAKEGGAK